MQYIINLLVRFILGQTEDIVNRVKLHNEHAIKGFTSRFPGKWELIYSESVATRQDALKREKQLKGHKGRDYIKQQLNKHVSGHIPE